MKKLIKTMAAVTAAVLTLSFVACSYEGTVPGDGETLGDAGDKKVTREPDVSEYAAEGNLMKKEDEED